MSSETPDDGKPKPKQPQPQPAVLLFSGEKRAAIKDTNPEARLGDIAKIIGQASGEVSEEDKTPCIEQAAKPTEEKTEKYTTEDIAVWHAEDIAVWRVKRVAEGHESDEEPSKKKNKGSAAAKESHLNYKSDVVHSDDDVGY